MQTITMDIELLVRNGERNDGRGSRAGPASCGSLGWHGM